MHNLNAAAIRKLTGFIFAVLFSVAFLQLPCWAAETEGSIRLVNHQDYAIHLPVTIRQAFSSVASLSDGEPVQQDGSNTVFITDIPANGQKELSFQATTGNSPKLISIAAVTNGIELTVAGKKAGQLTWDLIIGPKKKREDGDIVSTKEDYAKAFQALNLSFAKTGSGAVFDTWKATGNKSGLGVSVEMKLYHEGFIDF
ncbi:MAG: hypothetical protein JWQ71_4257, partial [Pedosphaera sp.]|nr:hypothetical protein [Pedosphaera sp.]